MTAVAEKACGCSWRDLCERCAPACTTCGDTGEVVECPPRCDGSHIADVPWPCPDCSEPS